MKLETKRKAISNYYRVYEEGSSYKDYSEKSDAIDEAVKASVGSISDVLVYRVVVNTELTELYDSGLERDNVVIKRKTTTETLAVSVTARKRLGFGGWIDYEE